MSKPVEVENIHVLNTWDKQCNESCISILEDMLVLAREGKMKECVVVFALMSGRCGDARSMMDDRVKIFGAMQLAIDSMSARIRESDKPLEDFIDPDDKDPA